MESFVQLKNINKRFNHVIALENASVNANKGEVLAIIGDNGAGKSTLIKILSGVLQPDGGEIIIDGKSFDRLTVDEALKNGVCTVYQDLALGDTMDVAANFFIGREITKFGVLQKKEMHRQSRELLDRLEINIPDTRESVKDLSGGQRQGVAVARLIHRGGNILIFDEPTAAMGVAESERTLELIRGLADKGMVVIMISHNMAHVFRIADRVAVMRHGHVIVETETENLSIKQVVELLTSADAEDTNKDK
ncbi:MAG: sugar ABC transporter ATP-binding protein [Mogibacterium sp.]|nr:sugar ABC transporter ATP-binding protein [Mogibacterium sp.]